MVSEKSKEVLEAQLRVSRVIRSQFVLFALPLSLVVKLIDIFVGHKVSRDTSVLCGYL
jgi:hypothetical protein